MNPRLLTALGLLVLAPALATCGGPDPAHAEGSDPSHAPPAGEAGHAGHERALSGGEPAAGDASIYTLGSTWTDQTGREVELGELAGRPRVVALLYTRCTFSCPRIMARMKHLEARAGDEVGFVVVSLDPDRDTPERLAEFAGDMRLDPERWTLLTGPAARVREISVLLGVPYRTLPDGEVAHANVLTLLDEEGVIVERVEGLDGDLEPLARRLGGG
jgi:protein SCO1/2